MTDIQKQDDAFFAAARAKFGSLTTSQVICFNNILSSDFREDLLKSFKIDLDTATQAGLSVKGLDFLSLWEGLKTTAYQDSVGIWTIGIGTIRYPNGKKVQKGDTCTKEQAYAWCKDYMSGVEACIARIVKVPLNQNQYDALCSLIYNIGESAFINGTVDDKLNKGDFKAALETWGQYRKAGGKVTQGLVNRRNAEIALFNS